MGGARNKPTASPSYHGRRGATRGKTPTASPDTAGQPHHVTQNHQSGPTPPHTVTGWIANSAKGEQATRVTIVTEHTRLSTVTDTGSFCRPRCQTHLALGQSTNREGAFHPTPGGLVRDTHSEPPKCRSRVGRGGSWKQRHLSQIGEGVRLHMENGLCFCTVHT